MASISRTPGEIANGFSHQEEKYFRYYLPCAYCQAAEKCSPGCFFALTCCTLQTWGAHMKHAGLDIQENDIDRIVYMNWLARACRADEDRGPVQTAANAVVHVVAALSSAAVRTKLVETYFKNGEKDKCPELKHLFCMRCAYIQEIEAVQRRLSKNNTKIGFGPFGRCWRYPVCFSCDWFTCDCFSCVQPWNLKTGKKLKTVQKPIYATLAVESSATLLPELMLRV